jgi:hypothetical protein
MAVAATALAPPGIDVDSAAGKALARLWKKLAKDQARFERIDQYRRGEPPLPTSSAKLRDGFKGFQKKARANFAELAAEAVRERLRQTGLRTPVAQGTLGDLEAFQTWELLGGPLVQRDVHDLVLNFGRAYVIVGFDNSSGRPLPTAEDPRLCIVDKDPRTGRVRSALKVYRDEDLALDFAHLMLPGEVHVAVRDAKGATLTIPPRFNARQWQWADERFGAQPEDPADDDGIDRGGPLPAGMERTVPVVEFLNRDGVGEYERHTDLLDRINHMILQRLVIATLQAFRQRAVKGDLPEKDSNGNDIDYDELFSADPGALWQLPDGVELWESATADLSSILTAVKHDVLHYCAVTRTPIAMMLPDDAAQSAEGADFQREGLVHRCRDRLDLFTPKWSEVHALIYTYPGQYHNAQRSDVTKVRPLWEDVVRRSLAEQASAFAQLHDLPLETRYRIAMQASPEELELLRAERQTEALYAARVAAMTQAMQPAAAPAAAEPQQQQTAPTTPAPAREPAAVAAQ